jgi:hypothetical protein
MKKWFISANPPRSKNRGGGSRFRGPLVKYGISLVLMCVLSNSPVFLKDLFPPEHAGRQYEIGYYEIESRQSDPSFHVTSSSLQTSIELQALKGKVFMCIGQ